MVIKSYTHHVKFIIQNIFVVVFSSTITRTHMSKYLQPVTQGSRFYKRKGGNKSMKTMKLFFDVIVH